jgi:Zn-dependent M28 family amino/carboxypeptidase
MRRSRYRPVVLAALLASAACGGEQAEEGDAFAVDAAQLMADVRTLAADDMEGRGVGTPGGARARTYVEGRFIEAGIAPLGASYSHRFTFAHEDTGETLEGVNVVGLIRGVVQGDIGGGPDERVIVVSAHYDHEGIKDGAIHNGADDNASGVAAMLQIARRFAEDPPVHTLVFVAFDAEEDGHNGAGAFVADPPFPRETIALNVNLDMVSQSAADELYVAGGRHAPWLAPWLEWIANDASVTLLQGHDGADPEQDDWSDESDHGAFHAAGIPFLYFGVEDHAYYHQPTDDPETIPVDFFTRSTATIVRAVEILDAELDAILAARADWEAGRP